MVRVSIRGTQAAGWDEKTWARLLNLALNCPESGIHLQRAETLVHFLVSYYDKLLINIGRMRDLQQI